MAHVLDSIGSPASLPVRIVSSITLAVAFLVVVYVIYDFFLSTEKQSRSDAEETKSGIYEDEDGTATEESQKEQSASILFWVSSISVGLGLLMSVLLIGHTSRGRHRKQSKDFMVQSLDLATWILLVVLTSLINVQKKSVTRFTHGRLCGLSTAILIVSNGLQTYLSAHDLARGTDREEYIRLAFILVEILCSLLLCISSLSIPRRPDVEVEGHRVDRQYTVSSLSYWTLSWAGDVLSLSRTKHSLEIEDLPKLHYKARSSVLLGWFGNEAGKRALWISILYMHWHTFLYQTIFTIFQAAIQFIPQLAMYKLLRLLEQNTSSAMYSPEAWFLVLALGLSILLAAWGDSWNAWMAYANLAVQLRSELSALIFAKATRRKDVKEARSAASGTGEADATTTASQINTITSPNQSAPQAGHSDNPDDLEKTRQSTINLVSVDAKRVSDFLRFHYLFVDVATQLTVSVLFLVQLMGWIPVLAGFGAFFVQVPINIIVSKRFTDAQGDLMQVRDRKLMVVTEALQGIRQIKFSAQETQWQRRIDAVRTTELNVQWQVFCLDTVLIFCWVVGPILLSAVAIAVYTVVHGNLSASVAFTSIALFGSLEFILAVIPEFTADGLEAWVSCGRIEEYLAAPEREEYTVEDTEIVFNDASIAWPSDKSRENANTTDRFSLQHLGFRVPKKKLTVISGATGTGKSLLLASLIGEAELLSGEIRKPRVPSVKERCDQNANKNDWVVDSSVAYVAQIPWIENATIKQNILFGLPYDRGRYNKVVESCALTKDFEILEDGDSTDIGFNGINLSGGQRWRVTFARALYSRAGILVLDDIFSAVDAQVGRQLFEDALTGELGQGRTRILVTHHVDLVLPKAAYIISLGEGTNLYVGGPEGFRPTKELQRVQSLQSQSSVQEPSRSLRRMSTIEGDDLKKVTSVASYRSNLIDQGGLDLAYKNEAKKFVEDEKKEKGAVKLGIYGEWLTASGGLLIWTPIFGLFLFHQAVSFGRSWFVSFWTRSYEAEAVSSTGQPANFSQVTLAANHAPNLTFYLSIYLGISTIKCISGTLRYFLVYTRTIRASKLLFENMLFTVLRTPLKWLDTVPVGRVLNRFTADFESIDSGLGSDLGIFIYEALQLLSIIVAAVFVSPVMIIIALLLFCVCFYITRWYLDGAREIKRLESVAKSPIFETFGATLSGIGTIRAFDKTEVYIERMFANIDGHARAFWHLWLFNRWLSFRLNFIGAAFSMLTGAIVAFSNIDASLAGFALGFALQYSSAIVWATRFYSNVELSMNSVERVVEYSKLPTEDQSEKRQAPAAWPTEGRLEVDNLVVGYAPDLPPVLKGLNFRVESRERVGVVGRTGAGKSSLTLALFRFLEAREGSIIIDGINVADISLQVLRSRLAIIPQDPVLFSGTVRSNLDPFDEHTDENLQDALQRVQIVRSSSSTTPNNNTRPPSRDKHTNPSTPPQQANTNASITLNTPISESGLNLSQGQRQLLCLARAIVRRPKILVLDEATSAVDMETDLLIQRSIRHEFRDATLLVIAHRLSTIADFDKILVMREGKGVEFGTPGELLRREGEGVFKSLVEESGEREELRRIIEEGSG
ncbi:uncharacterized protein KY384_001862 [Bacidia gigantensis]|uniref:uncharacterized protein n=1 Tax=Bacidia gigantensis TaxID=2732470 RepID=UPI001D058FCB|nr:uncharacterized protein KY384_001862 [Bacidia gigantensis]KAG8533079.1 hypothetical protein KY384_001862 [Bacidia gigantensis]